MRGAVRFFETQGISKHVFTKAETDLMICRHCREVIFKKKTLQVGKKKKKKENFSLEYFCVRTLFTRLVEIANRSSLLSNIGNSIYRSR